MKFRHPGFSMVEMLAVAALAVIIAGFSVAGVGRFGRYQATADLGTFNSYLRHAFTRAVRDKLYLRITVDLEHGKYWMEKTDTPFYLFTGEAAVEREEENEKLIERMESGKTSDPFANSGSALSVGNLIDKAKLLSSSEELENSDYYNYENFIPDRRSLKELLKPEFTKFGSEKKLSGNLIVTGFYAYHTPEIVTREDFMFSDKKKDVKPYVYIYIFPEGRIEPFYLAIGEENADEPESYAYITSDMFLSTKIESGGIEDVVEDMRNLFEDEDAEGK